MSLRVVALLSVTVGLWLAVPVAAQIDGPTLTTDGTSLFVERADHLERGAEVAVTFRNHADGPHDLYVVRATDAHPDHEDTSVDMVLGGVTGVPAGMDRKFVIEVPIDAMSLVFWCDQTGHEGAGEWLEVATVEMAPRDENKDQDAPSPSVALPLVCLLGFLVLLRRRR